jgi:GH24 family phage-related lysozyme (muramidase)
MATGSDVLKEFVVALGFKVDERSMRNVGDAIQKMFRNMTAEATEGGGMIEAAFGGITMAAGALATAVTAAVGTMVGGFVLLEKAVGRVSSGLANLYYQAQRAGSTVRGLRAVESAAQTIGFHEGQGAGAVEAMGTAMAGNPGLAGLLRKMGVNPRGDTADVFSRFLQRLQKMPTYIAEQYAGQFGMGQGQYLQYRANLPAYLAEQKHFAANEKASGFDAEKAAQDAVRYERALVQLNNQLSRLGGMLAVQVMPYLTKFNDLLARFFETFESSGRAHEVIARLSVSLGKLFEMLSQHKEQIWNGMMKAFDLLDWVVKDIGREIDDVSRTTKEFGEYANMAKKAFDWLWDHTPAWVRKAADWIDDPKKSGIDAPPLPGTDAWSIGRKAGEAVTAWWHKFIQHNEAGNSFSPTAYPDQGGMSIGYGHQIQPGEEYLLKGSITKDKAEELFKQDTGKARANVLAQTKGVKLNDEMLGALIDLAYNLKGGLSDKKTGTLLAALRSGNYEAAAKAFEMYDHAGGVVLPGLAARRAQDAQHFRLGMQQMGISGGGGKQVHLTQDTKITVSGAGEPQAVARHVANEQQRVNRDAVRNLKTRTN